MHTNLEKKHESLQSKNVMLAFIFFRFEIQSCGNLFSNHKSAKLFLACPENKCALSCDTGV